MKKTLLAVTISATLLTACEGVAYRDTAIGAAIGAVAGAVIGHQIDGKNGRYYGAVIGAVGGGAVGVYMDKQRQAMEEQLRKEREAQQAAVTQLPDNAIRVNIASDASFDVGKSTLSSDAQVTFGKVSTVLKEYDKTIVYVIGNTDADGSDEYNQKLSEERAKSVSSFLTSKGVNVERVRLEGRGESDPVAPNDTAANKRKNRRVDIVIKPIVEGQEDKAIQQPGRMGFAG